MGERIRERERSDEMAELERLYAEIYDVGLFVKEFRYNKKKSGAAVGTQEELAAALGLDSTQDITTDTIDNLPPFIPFAMPGIGDTRVEAVQDAYEKMQEHLAQRKRANQGEVPSTSVYGSFEVGSATVTAYLPDQAPDNWIIIIECDGERLATETLPMVHPPIFGPDAEDVGALNEFIEALIKKYELE